MCQSWCKFIQHSVLSTSTDGVVETANLDVLQLFKIRTHQGDTDRHLLFCTRGKWEILWEHLSRWSAAFSKWLFMSHVYFPTAEGCPSKCFTLLSGRGSMLHPNKQSDPGKWDALSQWHFLFCLSFHISANIWRINSIFSKYFCCFSYNIKQHRHCKNQTQKVLKAYCFQIQIWITTASTL